MPSNEIGSIRFEKATTIKMVRVEPYGREVETLLASKTEPVLEDEVAVAVGKVLGA